MACSLFSLSELATENPPFTPFLASEPILSGRLLSAILHEIQQPLIAVQLRARNGRDILENSNQLTDAMQDIFGDIEGCATSAINIGQRLRLLSHERPLDLQPVNLHEALRGLSALATFREKTRDVTVELRLAAENPVIMADLVSLQHALLDLVRNGAEALREHDERLIIIETTRGRYHVELGIRDMGPGIAEADRQRLFQPFFTTKQDGTGLGLAIARSIIEAHGGILNLDDAVHPGACFRISLPSIVGQANADAR